MPSAECRPFYSGLSVLWHNRGCRMGELIFPVAVNSLVRGYKRETVLSYNGDSSTGKMASLYWHVWWRHQMETFSALLAICAGNSPVPGEFPAQRPVTRSSHVFFDLCLNKPLNKQSWGWWFETLSRPLWRQCNATPGVIWLLECQWMLIEDMSYIRLYQITTTLEKRTHFKANISNHDAPDKIRTIPSRVIRTLFLNAKLRKRNEGNSLRSHTIDILFSDATSVSTLIRQFNGNNSSENLRSYQQLIYAIPMNIKR